MTGAVRDKLEQLRMLEPAAAADSLLKMPPVQKWPVFLAMPTSDRCLLMLELPDTEKRLCVSMLPEQERAAACKFLGIDLWASTGDSEASVSSLRQRSGHHVHASGEDGAGGAREEGGWLWGNSNINTPRGTHTLSAEFVRDERFNRPHRGSQVRSAS